MRLNQRILLGVPQASAQIKGSTEYPQIKGLVSLYAAGGGTVAVIEINGLPRNNNFFAVHIHNGNSCTGNEEDPFANAGTHLNLTDNEHPFHTGDLPVILSNGGYAWSAVFTDRFRPCQVKGCAVVIHSNADDFRTQPSGSSGEKIACGIIR